MLLLLHVKDIRDRDRAARAKRKAREAQEAAASQAASQPSPVARLLMSGISEFEADVAKHAEQVVFTNVLDVEQKQHEDMQLLECEAAAAGRR